MSARTKGRRARAAVVIGAVVLLASLVGCGGDDDENGDGGGTELALVTLESSDIEDVDDLGGVKVGVVKGSPGQTFVQEEVDAGEVRPLPDGFEAVQQVRTRLIDAAVVDLALAEEEIGNQASAAASDYAIEVRRVPSSAHIASTIPTD